MLLDDFRRQAKWEMFLTLLNYFPFSSQYWTLHTNIAVRAWLRPADPFNLSVKTAVSLCLTVHSLQLCVWPVLHHVL